MNLTIMLLNIVFLLMCLVFLILLKSKCKKSYKVSNDLIGFISRSSEILTKYEKMQESIQLRKSIKLYSLTQILLNISKSDYISFFKYVNDENDNKIDFLFSFDSNGDALQHSYLDKKNISYDLLKIIDINDINNDINYIYFYDINIDNNYFCNALKKRNLNKIYFKNIYDSNDDRIGLIMFLYKDRNYILSETDKIDMFKIIEETKYFL